MNAGHNSPIVSGSGAVRSLAATGVPLGLFDGAEYKSGSAVLEPGGAILLFTDGLTDAIAGDRPEERLHCALAADRLNTLSTIKFLVDPAFNEDDVTIVLVRRMER